jgi:hypothetical protein
MGSHRMVSESLHSCGWSLVIESLVIPDSEQENEIMSRERYGTRYAALDSRLIHFRGQGCCLSFEHSGRYRSSFGDALRSFLKDEKE